MVNNPIVDQVMQEKDNEYLSEQFHEHCKDKAIEISKEFNLLSVFIEPFTEYFTDLCLESDEGFSLVNDKSLIDEWWEENSDMYEDPSPYEDYEPTDYEIMTN